MPGKLFGRATVTFNGVAFETMPGATLDIGGTARSTVTGNKSVGYTEANTPSAIDCSIMFDADTRLQPLRDAGEGSGTFECDTGQVYTIRRCWLTNTPRLATGQAQLRFEGEPAQEVTA